MGAMNRLSALAVSKMGPGKYCDGAGLYLQKKSESAGKWIFIFTFHGRKREMGLGSYPIVSLKAAREDAEKWRGIPAMPWQEVPAFYASLKDGSVTHLAMRLLILTGVRSRPLRFIHENQIDGEVWAVPGEAMKGEEGKTPDFRVPLSKEALNVIGEARRHARSGFLFPSIRKGVISDMTMAAYMERAGMEYRPHGFRSSLRDWIAETTATPHDIAETVLSHNPAIYQVPHSRNSTYPPTDKTPSAVLRDGKAVVEAPVVFQGNMSTKEAIEAMVRKRRQEAENE